MKKFMLLVFATKVVFCFAQTDTLTFTHTMQDIDVVASNVTSSAPTVSSTSQDEIRHNNMGENLPMLLSNTPGLIVTSDDGIGVGYTYFRLRGTDHTRINVTLDDVPVNNSESQTMFWVNMTDLASSVSSIDVQRGVGSSVNGSESFGGSISMHAASTLNKPYFTGFTFNGGMYGTFRETLEGGYQWKNGAYLRGRVSKVDSRGYIERATSNLASYNATAGWHTNSQHLMFNVFGGHERTYMAWDGLSREQIDVNRRFNPAGMYFSTTGDTAYYRDQTDNYQEHHFQLSSTSRLTSSWSLRATAFYTFGKGYYDQLKTTWIRQKHLINHFYGALVSAKYVSEPADLQMGLIASNYLGHHYGLHFGIDNTSSDGIGKNETDVQEYYRSRGDKFDANIYARTNVRLINQAKQTFSLYADLQYRFILYRIRGINDEDLRDLNIREVFHFFNPKVGLNYTNQGHTAYATFAIANREPTRKNYTEAGMNAIPRAERLYDYEAGYNYTLKRSSAHALQYLQTGINFYFMDYRNQLVLTGKISDTGACLTQNVDRSYRMGAELSLSMQILPWLGWQTNLCLSRNKILDFIDFFDTYDDDFNWLNQTEHHLGNVDIAFSPSVTFSSAVSVATHGFEATLHTQVVGKQYLDNTMSAEAMLKPYSVSNLTMQYLLPFPDKVPGIRILLKINNIFNARYESNGGCYAYMMSTLPGSIISSPWFYPQATINVHAGFNITL